MTPPDDVVQTMNAWVEGALDRVESILDAKGGVVEIPVRDDGGLSKSRAMALAGLALFSARLTGDPEPRVEFKSAPVGDTRVCSVPGCGRPAVAHKMCNAHALRTYRGGAVDAPVRQRMTREEMAVFDAQVLDLWGQGFSDAQAADRLGVEAKKVAYSRSRQNLAPHRKRLHL